ncbi:MAG: replication initiator protein A [Eubacteriales bacterium]
MTQYDYFYDLQEEGHVFLSVPKLLFTHPFYQELTCEARILYGFLLELMKTSEEEQWQDEENRNYVIFPVAEAMKMLNVGRTIIQQSMSELVKIGLIEKKKCGFGKPDLIYPRQYDRIIEEWSEETEESNIIDIHSFQVGGVK